MGNDGVCLKSDTLGTRTGKVQWKRSPVAALLTKEGGSDYKFFGDTLREGLESWLHMEGISRGCFKSGKHHTVVRKIKAILTEPSTVLSTLLINQHTQSLQQPQDISTVVYEYFCFADEGTEV